MFTSFTPNNSGLSNLNVFTNTSSSIFVIVIAVNIEANVPIVKVTANPFTGPVPNVNKIVAGGKQGTYHPLGTKDTGSGYLVL